MILKDMVRPYINVVVSRPEWATKDAAQAPIAARGTGSDKMLLSQDYLFEDLWYTLLGALLNTLLEPTAESKDTIGFSILGMGRFMAQWRRDTEELLIVELTSGNIWSFKSSPGGVEYGLKDPRLAGLTGDDISKTGEATEPSSRQTILHSLIAWVWDKVTSILSWFRDPLIYIYIIPVPIMLIAVVTAFSLSDRRGRRLFRSYSRYSGS